MVSEASSTEGSAASYVSDLLDPDLHGMRDGLKAFTAELLWINNGEWLFFFFSDKEVCATFSRKEQWWSIPHYCVSAVVLLGQHDTNGLPYILRVNTHSKWWRNKRLYEEEHWTSCRALVQLSVCQLQLLPPVFLGSQSSVSREDATVLKHTRGFVL